MSFSWASATLLSCSYCSPLPPLLPHPLPSLLSFSWCICLWSLSALLKLTFVLSSIPQSSSKAHLGLELYAAQLRVSLLSRREITPGSVNYPYTWTSQVTEFRRETAIATLPNQYNSWLHSKYLFSYPQLSVALTPQIETITESYTWSKCRAQLLVRSEAPAGTSTTQLLFLRSEGHHGRWRGEMGRKSQRTRKPAVRWHLLEMRRNLHRWYLNNVTA